MPESYKHHTPDGVKTTFDLLVYPNFLDEPTCQKIIDETGGRPSHPATVYGQSESGSVNERVRRASRLTPSEATSGFVKQRLLDFKKNVEQHFHISLNDCEEPQFVRYDVGDFFVAHQDGNTGLIRLASDKDRKISIVIFLNNQAEVATSGRFCGGTLRFSDHRAKPEHREFNLPTAAGMLVAFRSELTHEVTPITHGERYSIVSWYR